MEIPFSAFFVINIFRIPPSGFSLQPFLPSVSSVFSVVKFGLVFAFSAFLAVKCRMIQSKTGPTSDSLVASSE